MRRDINIVHALLIAAVFAVTGFCAGVSSYTPANDGFYCARRDTKSGECSWYVRIREGVNR